MELELIKKELDNIQSQIEGLKDRYPYEEIDFASNASRKSLLNIDEAIQSDLKLGEIGELGSNQTTDIELVINHVERVHNHLLEVAERTSAFPLSDQLHLLDVNCKSMKRNLKEALRWKSMIKS